MTGYRIALLYGSRTWARPAEIDVVVMHLRDHHPGVIVLHGDHWEGADLMIRDACRRIGVQQIAVPANWTGQPGRAAGPRRNALMAALFQPDVAVGFRMPGRSSGTDDMSQRCTAHGIPWALYTPEHSPRAVLDFLDRNLREVADDAA